MLFADRLDQCFSPWLLRCKFVLLCTGSFLSFLPGRLFVFLLLLREVIVIVGVIVSAGARWRAISFCAVVQFKHEFFVRSPSFSNNEVD